MSIFFVDKEDNQISPSMRLSHRGINVFAGTMSLLDEAESQATGEDFPDICLRNVVFSTNLLDDFIEPNYAPDLQLNISSCLKPMDAQQRLFDVHWE